MATRGHSFRCPMAHIRTTKDIHSPLTKHQPNGKTAGPPSHERKTPVYAVPFKGARPSEEVTTKDVSDSRPGRLAIPV